MSLTNAEEILNQYLSRLLVVLLDTPNVGYTIIQKIDHLWGHYRRPSQLCLTTEDQEELRAMPGPPAVYRDRVLTYQGEEDDSTLESMLGLHSLSDAERHRSVSAVTGSPGERSATVETTSHETSITHDHGKGKSRSRKPRKGIKPIFAADSTRARISMHIQDSLSGTTTKVEFFTNLALAIGTSLALRQAVQCLTIGKRNHGVWCRLEYNPSEALDGLMKMDSTKVQLRYQRRFLLQSFGRGRKSIEVEMQNKSKSKSNHPSSATGSIASMGSDALEEECFKDVPHSTVESIDKRRWKWLRHMSIQYGSK